MRAEPRPVGGGHADRPHSFRYAPCIGGVAAFVFIRPGGHVSKLLRGVVAGYGAKKLTGGCGCLGIIVFIILWMILGNFRIFQ